MLLFWVIDKFRWGLVKHFFKVAVKTSQVVKTNFKGNVNQRACFVAQEHGGVSTTLNVDVFIESKAESRGKQVHEMALRIAKMLGGFASA